eukprot:CAMPEP_0202900530 /NCGR_PEP_ID=MMETSP1392-20130828/11885_1 /ASSEMBLY_ACC=CAM_ASM_000868 /TAXON_ID=225041 /ORGANISM="Chlamydomonas chlamydogama, Strain SAG 11-48b" /LENGTH=377 /DNA_ID=CAMNT_0049586935 /DNA_START=153 /DNA_END=1286 /DNA_ORIENTATION=+
MSSSGAAYGECDMSRSSSNCSLRSEFMDDADEHGRGPSCKDPSGEMFSYEGGYMSGDISLDSSCSEQGLLTCDEFLLSEREPGPASRPGARTTDLRSLQSRPQNTDVAEILKNEYQREMETRPSWDYLVRHIASCLSLSLTEQDRSVAVSWLVEVVSELGLQQETLFLGVSYLDRFLSLSQGVHRGMLQLVAVACMSLAGKQEEVTPPPASDWHEITEKSFRKEDLIRMEWVVIDHLGWRGRSPTPYSFLHLLCYGAGTFSALSICGASYLAELSLLSYSMLKFSYSTTAAAALLLAHSVLQQPFTLEVLRELVPGLDMSAVQTCAAQLRSLLEFAHLPRQDPNHVFQPIYAKYCTPDWCEVARVMEPYVAGAAALA